MAVQRKLGIQKPVDLSIDRALNNENGESDDDLPDLPF